MSDTTSPICGGHSTVELTEEVIALAVGLKTDVENTLSSTFETFEPVAMTTQVRFFIRKVAGLGRCVSQGHRGRVLQLIGPPSSLGRRGSCQESCDGAADNFEEFRRFADFTLSNPSSPLFNQTQVVAGTVYHVKINTGSDHVHARIFKPLPHTGAPATLQKAVGGFSADDAIVPL
jgi:hypothetical protein